jgi:Phage MuF-C-terminal domain
MENMAFKTALGLLIKSMMHDDDTKQHTNHQLILPIGPTPQVLLDLGMPDLQLVILGKVVDKALFDHGIPKGTIERLYSLLEAPKAIFKGHQDNPGSAVVTFEVKNMDPIIIAIHPNKQIGGRVGTAYNNVASMYAKETRAGESIEERWTREGLLLWKAKPAMVTPTLKVVGYK